MLGLPPSVRIYFATALVDMRNGVDGLRTIVEQVLKRNPNEGHLFVFVGKRRDMLKILFWDRNGYVVYFKHARDHHASLRTCVDADHLEPSGR